MTQLPLNPTEVVNPGLRGAAMSRDIEQRVSALESRLATFASVAAVRALNFVGPFDGSAGSNGNVTLPAGEFAMIVQGSGYRTSAGNINLDFYLDGALRAQSIGYTNEVSSHKAMNMGVAIVTVALGAHTLGVRNGAPGGVSTSSDANDHAWVMFLPTNQ